MKKICLTPVKNEGWILETFLNAASLWADIIIIADQNSSDNTSEIAQSYNKVKYIKNNSAQYNEATRQQLLLEEARKFGKHNFLLALDADELLSANFSSSIEWKNIENAAPGTQFALQWANLSPDLQSFWTGFEPFILGCIDAGLPKSTTAVLHNPRIPINEQSPTIIFNEIKLLHLQYIYWERMFIKQIWYQMFEHYTNPSINYIDLYTKYNHFRFRKKNSRSVPAKWLYRKAFHGFDISYKKSVNSLYWLSDINKWFEEKGIDYFKKLSIWDEDYLVNHLNIKKPNFYYSQVLPQILFAYENLPNRFYKRALKKIINHL